MQCFKDKKYSDNLINVYFESEYFTKWRCSMPFRKNSARIIKKPCKFRLSYCTYCIYTLKQQMFCNKIKKYI